MHNHTVHIHLSLKPLKNETLGFGYFIYEHNQY